MMVLLSLNEQFALIFGIYHIVSTSLSISQDTAFVLLQEKDKLQKSHFTEQEKFFKELEKERLAVKKKADKELKKVEQKRSVVHQER